MEKTTRASKGAVPLRVVILAGALAALLLLVPATGAHAATVTKLADTDGESTPDDCSLREAIDTADGDIDFAPGLAGRIHLRSELPHLSHDVEVRGPGAEALTVRRDGDNRGPHFRIFNVLGGVNAEISGLTIANGYPVANCDPEFAECPPTPTSGTAAGSATVEMPR